MREREVGFIDKKHIRGAKKLLLLQVKSFKSQNNNIPKISQFLLYLWRSNFNREYQTLNFCFSSSPQKSDQWNLSNLFIPHSTSASNSPALQKQCLSSVPKST